MKQFVKRAVGSAIFASGLRDVLLRNTAVVVAFHRVYNAARPEGLTVSVPEFERYCQFFKDSFQVVSLLELVSRLERGQKLNRELAITFDDGYRDNFEHAAPVLERLSLPATFFVVTQWIGTDVVPWWDREEGVRYPWMTWEQVRSLHRSGFDIGCHTRTHVDLGAVSGLEAREEILGARHELEKQLGASVELFSYPYGKPSNLADSNRHLVSGSGFRCCCSSFGGVNTPNTNPFHIRRVPIHQTVQLPIILRSTSLWDGVSWQSDAFSSDTERRTVLRNVGSNWVLTLVGIAVTYVLTPFVIATLGTEGYGTWTLITSMTGYISLLALGVPMACVRYLAEHVAEGDTKQMNETIGSCAGLLPRDRWNRRADRRRAHGVVRHLRDSVDL